MTRRELMIDAFFKTIHELPLVKDENIFRSRSQAVGKNESPAVIIEPERDAPIQTTIPRIDWSLVMKVMIFTRAIPEDIYTPDQKADLILEKIHAKVMADQSLGGYAMGIEPNAVEFDFIDGDGELCITTVRYTIQYKTGLENLATL